MSEDDTIDDEKVEVQRTPGPATQAICVLLFFAIWTAWALFIGAALGLGAAAAATVFRWFTGM